MIGLPLRVYASVFGDLRGSGSQILKSFYAFPEP